MGKQKLETNNDDSFDTDKKNSTVNSTKPISIEKDFEIFADEIEEISKIEEGLENDFQTTCLYHKLTFEEGMTAFYTFASIITACISYEGKRTNLEENNNHQVFTLSIVSVFNILFCYSTYLRYSLKHQLKISIQDLTHRDTFWTTSYPYWMFAEMIYAIMGPNYGFYKVTFTTGTEWNMLNVEYDLNDLMLAFSFPRLYTLIRFFLICTPYFNDRAHRVTKAMGTKLSMLFAVKCIFYSHPVKMLLILMAIVVLSLSYMLKILEGPVWYVSTSAQENLINYNYYENCIWNVLVTMTTVGYGDFYPFTNLGRLVIILTAFCGSALISLMTLITGNKLSLSGTEKKVYDFGNRIDARKEKEDSATTYFAKKFIIKMRYNKLKRYVSSNSKNIACMDSNYKKMKTDIVDSLYQRILFKKGYKDNFYNFRNNYDPLDDNFAIQDKIKVISSKIEFMYDNFVNLEKSLDFIESLESKKFAEDEKMKLLTRMNEMQKYIESLEYLIKEQQVNNNVTQHTKKLSSLSDKKKNNNTIHERNNSNLSNTLIMNNKNAQLYNIEEYGYGENYDSEKDLEDREIEDISEYNNNDNK